MRASKQCLRSVHPLTSSYRPGLSYSKNSRAGLGMPACQAQAFQTLPKTPREPEHSSGLGLPEKHTGVFLSAIVRAPMVGSDLGDSSGPCVHGIYLQCPSLTVLHLPQVT